MKLLLNNILIVNEGKEFKGAILINNEKIEKIWDTPVLSFPENKNIRIINLEGYIALPGVIDTHVHFREPGLTQKADFFTESQAAVAGGVTTVFDMPNVKPPTTTIKHWQEKQKIVSQKSLVNYALYIGATNDNINELSKADFSQIPAIKVFMGSSTGNLLVNDINTLQQIFSLGKQIVAHCEDEQIIQQNLKLAKNNFGENIPISWHSKIRNEEACFNSTTFAVKLAQKHNTPFHLLHLSTAKELDFVEKNKSDNITIEVVINHLFFDETNYDELGTLVKFNPSAKTQKDRKKLIKSLNTNIVDIVSTDHAPHTLKEKQQSYLKAPSGVPMIQHSLIAMIELYKMGFVSLPAIAEKMAHNPAKIFNIEKRGFLREGYFADIVIIDTEATTTITKDSLLYKCKWSPFEGRTFHSKIKYTIINGQIIFDNGKINTTYRGMPVKFDR